ncbi:MAG: GMC oxidoreductase [Desulfobacteria bacterium]
MIIDARSLPDNETIEADVCIVGAGVAGITLAREFIGEGFRVCLLESGGLGPDRVTQSLCWGENIGHPYYPLDTARVRCFGGSSHRWILALGKNSLGARMHPLDGIDFEARDWVPYSGWPLDKSHLNPFYERAQSICQLGPFTYDVEDWEDPEKTPRLPFVNDRVKTTIFQFGSRDPFISEYRDEIAQAHNIVTYIHANAVQIDTTETAKTVTRVRVGCLQGNKFFVSARLFILSAGAIEIPRLLLLSNKTQNTGLGNQNDLVGRFFMEHPHLWSGKYIPSGPDILNSTALYGMHPVNKIQIIGKLSLSEDVLRSERLLNYCVSIHPRRLYSRRNVAPAWDVVGGPLLRSTHPTSVANHHKTSSKASGTPPGSATRHKMIGDDRGMHARNVINDINSVAVAVCKKTKSQLGRTFKKFTRSQNSTIYRLNHMSEQAPNPHSRITLADERDALGLNRVRLNWQLSSLDIHSIIRAQQLIDEELRRGGLGRLHIELKDTTPPHRLHGGWHHMGTTRMHTDSKRGVVNEHCRVHGISNLFVAGPSVFPTGGYANPILTIVGLAVRLADHVKQLMA